MSRHKLMVYEFVESSPSLVAVALHLLRRIASRRPHTSVGTMSKQEDGPQRAQFHQLARVGRQYAVSYLGNASIDGFKFLAQVDRRPAERFFWCVVITTAIGLGVALVIQTWLRWIDSPVIVTFSTSQTLVGEIPFPAITICPQIKSLKSKFNFTDYIIRSTRNQSLSDQDAKMGRVMSLVCNVDDAQVNGKKYLETDVVQVIEQLAPKLESFTIDTQWKHKSIPDPSDGYIHPVITSAGLCYTFNGLNKSDLFTDQMTFLGKNIYVSATAKTGWDSERGYSLKDDQGFSPYPRRTFLDGVDGGFEMTFYTVNTQLDYACGDAIQGYRVSVHHPEEMPNMKDNYFYLSLDQWVTVGAKPKLLITSEKLRLYEPHVRGCFFSRERILRFFAVYNQRNCLMECLANVTHSLCGCVNYYMPRDSSTPVCSIRSKECMDEARRRYNANQMDDVAAAAAAAVRAQTQCDCLPSCTALDFDTEISQSDWNFRRQLATLRQTSSDWNQVMETLYWNQGLQFSSMQIYFKDLQFPTLERSELYGYAEFWANVGGVIGLFTGFSFITLFEIIYYLSLRLICNVGNFYRQT